MLNALSSVHGWVVLDKPLHLTSAVAVSRVRRLFGVRKAGHGGTLDPLATGLLPVAIGEATKTVDAVLKGKKTYRFALTWGSETTTGDLEGAVSSVTDVEPTYRAIIEALPHFTGTIQQIPPSYSAIKINGKRAYERARDGEMLTLNPRTVEISKFSLIAMRSGVAEFEVCCGKGTYIRSLGRDLARFLGTLGHLSMLRRTAVGAFQEHDMIPLELLEELGHKSPGCEAVLAVLRPLRTVLDDIPALALSKTETQRLRQGQSVPLPKDVTHPEHETVLVLSGDQPVALAYVKGGHISPKRVFNLQSGQ